jgi:hypothetical protein
MLCGILILAFAKFVLHFMDNPDLDQAKQIMDIVGGVLVGLPAVHILAAVAFLRGVDWARIPLLIFAFLVIFSFPLGTLVGGYSIWAFLSHVPQAEPTAELSS